MNTLHFDITIAAPRETVARTMLEDTGYRDWTSVFHEGSHYVGSWDSGQRIRFLGPDGQGMLAEIAEHRPAVFLSIRHVGMLLNGVEDTHSEAVRAWAPCYENYHFEDAPGGGTLLRIDMDCQPAYEAYMTDCWPRALARLKARCEAGAAAAGSGPA